MIREAAIFHLEHNEDGSVTAIFEDFKSERYSSPEDIAAICNKKANDIRSEATSSLRYPSLLS